MPITLDPSLPRSLYPLAWLIGEWEGSGALAAPSPGTPDVRVEQRLVCTAQEDGTLAWRSVIHRVDAPAPLPPTSAFARAEAGDDDAPAAPSTGERSLLHREDGVWTVGDLLPASFGPGHLGVGEPGKIPAADVEDGATAPTSP